MTLTMTTDMLTRLQGSGPLTILRLMVKILHYLKDPKLWELGYIPYYG